MELVSVGLWELSLDGRTVYANPAMAEMLEVDSPDELIGRSFHPYFTPQSLERMAAEHTRRRTGESGEYEAELVGRRGGRRTVLVSGRPLLDAAGRVTGMLGTFTDISARKRIEDALRRSEIRSRQLLEACPDGVAVVCGNAVAYASPALCRMLGHTAPAELVGRSGVALVAPEYRGTVVGNADLRVRGESAPTCYEAELLDRAGRRVPVEMNVRLIEHDGLPAGLIVFRDLRGLREDRRELAESRARLHALIESLPFDVWARDREGRCVMQNANALAHVGPQFGLRPSEAGIPPEDAAVWESANRRAMAGEVVREESVVRTPDGAHAFYAVVAPIRDGGEIRGTVGVAIDVTERRAAEEALRRSEQRLALHFRQTPLGVIEWSPDFRVTDWNPAAERIFGWTREQALGRVGAEFLVPEPDRPAVWRLWGDLLAFKGGARSVNENLTADGRAILCDWYNTPLVDRDGRVIGVASLVQDITESRRAEEERARLLAAEQAARAEAEAGRRRLGLLAEASRLLGGRPDAEVPLQAVARLAVPVLADWCVIALLQPDGSILHPGAAHGDPAKVVELATILSARTARIEDVERTTMRSGEPALYDCFPEHWYDSLAPDPELQRRLRALGLGAVMCVPIRVVGQVAGVLTLMNAESGRRFGPADRALADDLSGRVSAALENVRLFGELGRRGEELRRLTQRLSAAEDSERRRLAADIHDTVGQTLSLARLNLDAAARRRPGEPEGPAALSRALALVDDALRQTRSLLFDLYPAMLDDLGLVPALQWYAEHFAARTAVGVSVDSAGRPRRLPTPMSGYLFRAVKELLANAARHGGAREVFVSLRWEASRLRIVVADDGRGFPDGGGPAEPPPGGPSRGLGLAGIRERVAGLGGNFYLESEPGRGAVAILDVPLPEGAAD
jgi:PAS domain S-box-containing protein